jgi:lipopolysaccharide export system permease protein
MISAVFTVAWLGRHQELTAMMAAGISKFRVIKPLLAAAAAVSVIGMLNRELVIPQVRDELTRDTKDLGGGAARELEPRLDTVANILIGGEKVVLGARQIIRPNFILLAPELNRYGKQLTAANAFYVDATDAYPAGFVLSGVTAPKGIAKMSSLQVAGRLVIATGRDATWLKPDEVFVASQVKFPLLASGSKWRNYASISELMGELRNPSANAGNDVRVTIHSRLTQFFMDGTLVFLGLPVMLSRRSRNVFLSIGICLGIATVFMLTGLACQSLGSLNLMQPALAAWLPLMVFVPVAAALSGSLRT